MAAGCAAASLSRCSQGAPLVVPIPHVSRCPVTPEDGLTARTQREHDLGQRIRHHAMFSHHGDERTSADRTSLRAMDVGSDGAPATLPYDVATAAGHAGVRDDEDGHTAVAAVPRIERDAPHLRPEHPQVAAGIDASPRNPGGAQALDGAIDRVAFRDPAEVDPEGTMKADRAIRERLHVAPRSPAIGPVARVGPGKQTPLDELGRDCDVEAALGSLCEAPRPIREPRAFAGQPSLDRTGRSG